MASDYASKGRWVRPVKSTYAPSCIIVVVPELSYLSKCEMTKVTGYELKAIHVSYTYRRGPIWKRIVYLSFTSDSSFWDWLERFASKDRRTYIFTDCILDTYRITGFWERIEDAGCINREKEIDLSSYLNRPIPESHWPKVTGQLELRPSVDPSSFYYFSMMSPSFKTWIVKYSRLGKTYQWTQFSNYCESTEDDIARAIRFKWTDNPDAEFNELSCDHTASERVCMWTEFFRQVCDWWISIDGGPWGPSIASMSYSFLKRRIPKETILHHQHDRAGRLEESAIIGGRRSTWFFGNIGDHFDWELYSHNRPVRAGYPDIKQCMRHFDIRSMYPYLLSRMDYPIQYMEMKFNPPIDSVIDAMQTMGVLAYVNIQTFEPEYPVKSKNGVSYPIGSFNCTLCGPELIHALASGRVRHIFYASYYMMGNPFSNSCNQLLKLRKHYRDLNEYAWEMFVKLLSNSMTGKIAQRQIEWVQRPDICSPVDWGMWKELIQKDDTLKTYKTWAGMTWERVQAELSVRPMGATYAYLTAYGRYYMRHIRSTCPPGTVLSQDTDGIWVANNAFNYLCDEAGWIPYDAGNLCIDKSSAVGRFYGPQYYWHGESWVLSGQAAPKVIPDLDCIRTVTRETNSESGYKRPEAVVYRRENLVYLARLQVDGDVRDDGWVEPFKLFSS